MELIRLSSDSFVWPAASVQPTLYYVSCSAYVMKTLAKIGAFWIKKSLHIKKVCDYTIGQIVSLKKLWAVHEMFIAENNAKPSIKIKPFL